ncbi:GntR family transcriptional regulator [Frigidibacter sp. MR17.24]|uniref:GntR family transcriptional regulator n=1 Tax=Frigidibacter sp. MR17.24 TaxID=3127345 RepID=UPI003012F390
MSRQPAAPRENLAARIAEHIRAAIIDGELELGENLSEDSLATAFGCSRTPVRAALNQLQIEGLVHVVPQSGTYIFRPTHEDVAELCDFRATLEMAAARDIAGRPQPALARLLEDQIAAMERAAAAGDSEGYGRADTAFHRAIVEAAGNRHLQQAYLNILGRVAALRTHLVRHAEGEPARSFADHRRIAAMTASGAMAELPALLEHHILRTRENYLNAMARRASGWGDPRTERLRRRLLRDGAETFATEAAGARAPRAAPGETVPGPKG